MEAASRTRRDRPLALLLAVALLAAAAGARAQVGVGTLLNNAEIGDTVPVGMICTYVTAISAQNRTRACELVSELSAGLLALPGDTCPDPTDTGFGKQAEPDAQAADGARRACRLEGSAVARQL
ncbi:MAG: hypothetical protein J3K34DRAFT_35501 [Monoraphidium minutum]|nr:MAG: hypothetical protein J3K34DRAFT_35501 [Monoraphidium minutum]